MTAPCGHRRYFDNAATSWPKAPPLASTMRRWVDLVAASPGRGAYREVQEATEVMDRCRERLSSLIGATHSNSIVLTLNCTDALTLAIDGMARHARRSGRPVHMVTSMLDHNSILRPLHGLESDGVRMTVVPVDQQTGRIDPDDVSDAIESDTILVAMHHGSNVSGTLQPIAEIGARCRHHGVPFLVDAAQTLGRRHIHIDAMNIDLLAFPGHKSLLGPLGTGGLWIRPGLEDVIDPVRLGGTGSRSDLPVQPTELPDRYEAGSHNMPGIAGLDAALGWMLDQRESLFKREQCVTEWMLDRLLAIDNIQIIGPTTPDLRCAVFSLTCDHLSPFELADALEAHDVLTRAGLHCAPFAHQTFGTLDRGGTLRLSAGSLTTDDDVEAAMDALATTVSQSTKVALAI